MIFLNFEFPLQDLILKYADITNVICLYSNSLRGSTVLPTIL